MENDPDYDAMTNAPLLDAGDDVDMQQTTVIEGGASGGLFVQDDSDDDVDQMMRENLPDTENGNAPSHDSDSLAGHQLRDDDDADEDDEEEEQGDEEDDDPIVKTYQICATKILSEHLYLFQYPIRPANRPYESGDCPSEARIKPRIGQVQIDIPIQETNYYDTGRATQWTEQPLRMQTLGGTIAPGRNYLIGKIDGDELHVTPVAGVAQIRPVFKYIDEHDRDEKDARKADAEKSARGPKTIQISAKSVDAMPDLSTTALIRAAEEENWTKLRWCDPLHQETTSVAAHMLSKKRDVLCKSMTKKEEYLDMLSTNGDAEKDAAKAKKENKDGR